MSDKTTPVRVAAAAARGRWRIGRHWSHKPTDAEVTQKELKALQADKHLSVLVMDGSVPLEPGMEELKAKLAAALGAAEKGQKALATAQKELAETKARLAEALKDLDAATAKPASPRGSR